MRWVRQRLFWGFALIGTGIIMLMITLGWLPANIADLWPVIVLILGIWLITASLRRYMGRGFTIGFMVFIVGVFWLAEGFNWVHEDLFLPTLFISFGCAILLRGLLIRRGKALI
jgi:multisubunit Na+/H+ antiporter MnhB subunit